MRRGLLAIAIAVVVVLGTALAVVLRDGTLREQAEHVIGGQENTLRPPTGEWVRSVPGQAAVVWAVGDSEAGTDAIRLARTIERDNPDRLLYLGDVYPIGTASSFDGWATAWGRFNRIAAPTAGNHDWPEADEGYDPYWRRATGRFPPTWYAFEAGGWEIVSVNSEAPHGAGSEQAGWLRRRMNSQSGDCRLVFWHRPRFSAGPRGDVDDVEPLWRSLPGHARLLLSAHEHNLQRFHPQAGVVPFVVGAGGRGHQKVSRDDPRLAFADSRTSGALRIALRPGRARWALVASGGRSLDSGSVRCTPLGKTPTD